VTTTLAPRWTIEVRKGDDALAGLRPEWTDLFRRCRTATPFQAHAWLDSWWRAYGRPGRLRVVLVRRGGTLVAAAAFIRVRRAGCAVLVPIAVAWFTLMHAVLFFGHARFHHPLLPLLSLMAAAEVVAWADRMRATARGSP